VRASKIKVLILALASAVAWADEPLDIVTPYRVPTFTGETAEFRNIQPAIKPAKKIDSDLIFRTIVNCYPVKPWGVDIQLRAAVTQKDESETTINTSDLGRYYIGVVARMPIYSEPEIERARNKEYIRRKDTTATIAKMIQALATKRRAERLLGLYMSLEQRAQLRVAEGIVETTEQIGYLEKVALTQAELDTANAEIEGARLALVGQCRPEVEHTVNDFLLHEIQ
jgi:hypothetical protein